MNKFIQKVIQKVSPWWPEIILISGGLWTQFGPMIRTAISAHPRIDSILAMVGGILLHLSERPTTSTK